MFCLGMMTISLCYTSVRPEFIPEVVKAWRARAHKPYRVEVVIAVDAGDAKSEQAAKLVERAQVVVQPEKPGSCVKGWNLAASYATGDVLLAIADDFVPPEGWDSSLEQVAEEGWWTKDRVVKVFDGYNPDLCTLAIVSRARYDRLGYLFYPGYLSLFSDTEFTASAYADGAVIEAMNLVFEHHHPDCGKRQRDDNDLNHASSLRWSLGESLFKYRKRHKFPVDLGKMAPSSRVEPNPELSKFAVYIQAVQDDFCLFEVCFRLASEGLSNFCFFVPSHYWSGQEVPPELSQEVRQVALQLELIGLHCHVVHMPVNFEAGPTRIDAETDFRNRSLDWMWTIGMEHAVIVDGDELWNPGFFKLAYPYMLESESVKCAMIPAIGLPGYPVDGASDQAVIHIRKNARFKACRTPEHEPLFLNVRGVVHFTATRKTHEEIIAKMRNGGHYDDPDYDFEGWILRKLPNIKPGMLNAHMYKPYQIWPMVREWTEAEAQSIPPSIRPYLGLPNPVGPATVKPSLSELSSQLLRRPPCQQPSFKRVGVFAGIRR